MLPQRSRADERSCSRDLVVPIDVAVGIWWPWAVLWRARKPARWRARQQSDREFLWSWLRGRHLRPVRETGADARRRWWHESIAAPWLLRIALDEAAIQSGLQHQRSHWKVCPELRVGRTGALEISVVIADQATRVHSIVRSGDGWRAVLST